MNTLTPRQREALDFIKSFNAEHGIGPSYDQIAAALGLKSKGFAHDLVSRLVERGAIRKAHGRARQFEILGEQGADFHLRKVLGAIVAKGTVDASDPDVAAACRFIVGAPA